MAKTHSQYVCQQCGYAQVGWAGKCPNCETWGSLVETIIEKEKGGSGARKIRGGKKPVSLSSIPSRRTPRTTTKISELDRVLGGGLVLGQVVLLAGEPGIGKSTLLLQLADKLGDTLYVSGEESTQQLKLRADRLKVKKKSIYIMEETDVDTIIAQLNETKKLSCVIIDSIQTMTTQDLSGLAGSVGQVRECAFRLLSAVKKKNLPLFLVGHVTKQGAVAGPAVLAHIVDTVLWFEGEKTTTLRLLRAVKNRFGPTDEVGIFSMEEKGLISMTDPEKMFLTKGERNVAGSVVSSVMEGSRPIIVEIQSLVVSTKLPFPRRIAQGIDSKRLELLIAVLARRCGLPLYEYDCFVNVTSGIKVKDTGVDLAICLSLASAYFNKALPNKLMAIGEVGLLGEIREVVAETKRLKEARRLGFNTTVSQGNTKYLNQAIKKFVR